jgi:hypothetical protein
MTAQKEACSAADDGDDSSGDWTDVSGSGSFSFDDSEYEVFSFPPMDVMYERMPDGDDD